MKFKLKIYLSILLAFITMSLFLLFWPIAPSNAPIRNQSLHIQLKQEKNGDFRLLSKELGEDYPGDYKLEFPLNDREFIIVGQDGGELFKGSFASKTQITMEILNAKNPIGETILEPIDSLKLYLPVYRKAKEILIVDKAAKKTLLSIPFDMNDYKITKGYKMTCGNGICDSNENIFSCFMDCRPYSVSR